MEELIQALKSVGVDLYHRPVEANAALPYIAYMEYSENYFKADDRIDEVAEYIQADYFTKTEFDPNKAKIRQALDAAGIVFEYQCRCEDEEKVYHHIFDCRVITR